MIEIAIKTDGKKIMEHFDNLNCTFQETASVLYSLEKIKQQLLEKGFENVEVREE